MPYHPRLGFCAADRYTLSLVPWVLRRGPLCPSARVLDFDRASDVVQRFCDI